MSAGGKKGAKARGAGRAVTDGMPAEMVSRFGAEPEAEMLTTIGVSQAYNHLDPGLPRPPPRVVG